ncbi:Putative secreted protein [Corynebacterium glyciniphilum AJ 3170]|uniref:Putative secreted protein n=2 Tax=Corynebacterium TaxID=1716 RepID=X5DVJ3_9CORY|nr:Putative secreted protein [Corynebacterium glyciniphilum AJ 3170]
MLGMMSVAVVALLLGLALLVSAAGLFWRASKQPSARQSRQVPASAEVEDDPTSGGLTDQRAVPPAGQLTESAPAPEPESQQEPRPAPDSVSDPEPAPELENVVTEADVPADPAPGAAPVGEPIPASRQDVASGVDEADDTASPASETSSNGLFAGRRARRQWAQSHGYEYAKEDRYLPGEWPDSLMTLIRADAAAGSATTVARDLVSGFTGGHQFHLAEVNGITVVALRREVFSPVQVHLSDGAAMPAGMRHSELCDRPPYTGYSSDNRALDRMLDSRVDASLHALAGSVSDIAFSTTWVAMKMARRTDPPIWDHVIVQGRALVAASRVLPPRVTSQELDMTNADPTRPRVRGTVEAAVVEEHAGEAQEQESQDEAPAQRGHLRAVPDTAPPESTPDEADGVDETSAENHPDGDVGVDRPRMERSTTPVDFPTRSESQTMGDISGFPDEEDEEAVDADPIPAVGEDPEHSRTASGGGPRVIRAADQRSTIFGDDEDSAGTTSAEVDIIGGAAGPASGGRHRAPSARHARHAGESGEQADYPEVDAEVVDPEDN